MKYPGLSFYVSFGRYAGFQIRYNKMIIRIILGWVAFSVVRCDLDFHLGATAAMTKKLIDRLAELEEQVKKCQK